MRFAIVVCLFFSGCAARKPLPVLGEVPAFRLTDQTGAAMDRTRLDGHVWVADFIYTTCQGPCPRMSSKMRALQTATPSSVRLVSFTVDPDRDTPAALAAYGKRFAADTRRWTFVTGDKKTLNTLDRDAFRLGTLGADMDHSTRFVLVDKKARIRGYYGIAEGDPVEKIAADAARLEKEDL